MANFPRVKLTGWSLNEVLTSLQQNTLDIDHTKAPNFDEGSSHTPAADIALDGTYGILLKSSLRLKYNDRSLWRTLPLAARLSASTGWDWAATSALYLTNSSTAASVNLELIGLPDGAVLDDIRLNYQGDTGHANDPVTGGITMPGMGLWSQPKNSTTSVSIVSAVYDDVTTRALYEAAHSWTLGGSIAHTIDTVDNRYFLEVSAESGGDYIANADIISVEANVTMSNHPEF